MLFLCYLGGHAYSCSYISKKYVTFLLVRQKDCFIHFTSATILVSTPGNYLGRNNALKLFRQPFRLICIFHFLFSLFEASSFFFFKYIWLKYKLNWTSVYFLAKIIFSFDFIYILQRGLTLLETKLYTGSHWRPLIRLIEPESLTVMSRFVLLHTHTEKKKKTHNNIS